MSVSVDPTNIGDEMQEAMRISTDGSLFLQRVGMFIDHRKKLEAATAEYNRAKNEHEAIADGYAFKDASRQELESATTIRVKSEQEAARNGAAAKIEADRLVATATASANAIVAQAQETLAAAQNKEDAADKLTAQLEQERKDLAVERVATENARGRANSETAKYISVNSAIKTFLQQQAATL
jgi:hypothetical protein